MKSILNRLKYAIAAGSLLVGSAAAQAAVINIVSGAGATAAHTALVGSINANLVVENFDGLGLAPIHAGSDKQFKWENSAQSFNTAVGIFTLDKVGNANGPSGDNKNLKIESRATGEFGREALATSATDFWLDSNDAKKVVWNVNTGKTFDTIGFLFADPNDQGAQLKITYANGDSLYYQFPKKLSSGGLHFVGLTDLGNAISATITFDNASVGGDGWGIDDIAVGVVDVPEPGTIALLGLGLAGLVTARRIK